MIKPISAENGYFEGDNMTDIKKYNLMIVVIIIASGITFGVELFIDASGSGGWMEALLCTFISAAVYPLLFNPAAIGEFGRSSGLLNKILVLFVTFGGIIYVASLTASVADNITTAFLNRTPVQYILLLLILPGAVGCWFGTKALARYGLPVAVGGIAVVVLLFIMCIGEYNDDNLYPLFGRGISGSLKGLSGIGIFAPIVFYYVVLSCCKGKYRGARSNVIKIILLSGLTVAVVCLGINLLMPYPGAEATSMPLYTLGASVRGNYLIERSESVVLILWLFCAYIAVGGVTAITSHMCAIAFGLDNRNALTGAFCGCVLTTGLIICAVDGVERAFSLASSILGILSLTVPLVINIRHRFVR